MLNKKLDSEYAKLIERQNTILGIFEKQKKDGKTFRDVLNDELVKVDKLLGLIENEYAKKKGAIMKPYNEQMQEQINATLIELLNLEDMQDYEDKKVSEMIDYLQNYNIEKGERKNEINKKTSNEYY